MMFGGLVRDFGQILSFKGNELRVKTAIAKSVQIGDSVAFNGACLTAISVNSESFAVELSDLSKKTLALENFAPGSFVHLERALKADDRLDGHLIQGHIDALGEIVKVTHTAAQSDFAIKLVSESKDKVSCILPKGSIAIDGVSLTIGAVDVANASFTLTIIPHTLQNTLFRDFESGRRVNIETDMFARNVFGILKNFQNLDSDKTKSWQKIDFAQMIF